MPNQNTRWLHSLSLLFCFCLVTGVARAAESDPDGNRYDASPDPAADVRQAIARAGENDRRALVVLGANWCHDSRALAARLFKPPLKNVIEEEYELVFVDVGYYDSRADVLSQFDVAQYYATPTVLIVDPDSGAVINHADRHQWGNAYRISMSDSVDYFESWAENDGPAVLDSPALSELNAQIDAFEARQAARVAGGYAVVGPMLEELKAGNRPEEFDASWDELSKFRNSIPGDVLELRDEAARRVAAGDDDIQLEFPEYPPLSWETG